MVIPTELPGGWREKGQHQPIPARENVAAESRKVHRKLSLRADYPVTHRKRRARECVTLLKGKSAPRIIMA